MLFTVFRGESPQAIRLEGPRVYLLPPRMADWKAWATLREESREFLTPWDPTWPHDALTRHDLRRRLKAYSHEWRCGTGFSFLVHRLSDHALMGGVTISNVRSEEHTSEVQSLMRISYAVFCSKKNKQDVCTTDQ